MIDFTAEDLIDVKKHYEEVVREIKQAFCIDEPVKKSNDNEDDDDDEHDYTIDTGVTISTEQDEVKVVQEVNPVNA